jgi:hypothetical protein
MATAATVTLGTDYVVPEEERRATRRKETYTDLLGRLSHQSVVKHFDAYADIPWDSEEYRVDVEDPRWELPEDSGLGATAWYRALPQATRARIGVHTYAVLMKVGLEFESILKRGLLEYAAKLPNGSPEFRYVYHEVIEEAQHSLMFQEFVNRTGMSVPGLPPLLRLGARQVIRFGRTFPELFFVFVLGGEDPIDHVQRTLLRSSRPVHPLLKRIMQIHVTEEARHLCFARAYLKEYTPTLGRLRKLALSVRAPIILSTMARIMMRPGPYLVRKYNIPKEVIAEAYTNNQHHRAETLEALRKVRDLLTDLGLVKPHLWRALGIWQTSPAR